MQYSCKYIFDSIKYNSVSKPLRDCLEIHSEDRAVAAGRHPERNLQTVSKGGTPVMSLEERKKVEDKILRVLDNLTRGEQAVLYKTLYALGLRLTHCDALIERAPPYAQDTPELLPRKMVFKSLPRGVPPFRSP